MTASGSFPATYADFRSRLGLNGAAEHLLAEGVGFEPTDACTSPVFKTGAIDHSATLPSE